MPPLECRACLEMKEPLHDLFSMYKEEYFLPKTIFDCTGIQVEDNEELPGVICASCADQLVEIQAFRDLYLHSDSKLRQRLAEWNVEYLTTKTEGDSECESVVDDASLTDFIDDTNEYSELEIMPTTNNVIKLEDQWNMDIAEEITLAEIELLSEPKQDDREDNYSKPTEIIARAAPVNDIRATYKCDHCDKAFASMSSLRTHNYIHNQGRFECPICPKKVLTNAGFLRVHMRKAHNIFAPKDDQNKDGSSTRPLKNLRECLCDICNRYFTKIGIITHMKSHQNSKSKITQDGNKVIKCPLCLLTFSCRKNVHRHMKNVHSDEKQNRPANYTCHLCSESFQIVVQLYEHFKTHDDTCQETIEGFDLNCDDCQTRLDTYEAYAKHVVGVHNLTKVKPYKCRFCSIRHGTRVALYMHITCHYETTEDNTKTPHLVRAPKKRNANQRYLCTICGNDFCTKQIMKHHMLIHSGEKPHECHYCQKKFRNASSLKEHIRVHTDERPYECASCPKAFRSHANLRNHRISAHSTVKKHSCHVCDKSFKFRANLRSHLWVHSDGDKPFNCSKCQAGFMRRKKLKLHMDTCLQEVVI